MDGSQWWTSPHSSMECNCTSSDRASILEKSLEISPLQLTSKYNSNFQDEYTAPLVSYSFKTPLLQYSIYMATV